MSDRVTVVRVSRTSVLWTIGIVVVFAVVGALCGLLWRSRLDVPRGVVAGHQWFPISYDSGERASFASTGWYVVIAVVAAVLLAVLAAWFSRAPELLTLGAVLVGSLLAAVLMLLVGLHGAPPDPAAAAAHAADGTHLSGTISRPGRAAFVVWPLVAVGVVGAFFLVVPIHRSTTPENAE